MASIDRVFRADPPGERPKRETAKPTKKKKGTANKKPSMHSPEEQANPDTARSGEIGSAANLVAGGSEQDPGALAVSPCGTNKKYHHPSILTTRLVDGNPPHTERRPFQELRQCPESMQKEGTTIAHIAEKCRESGGHPAKRPHQYAPEGKTVNLARMRNKAIEMSERLSIAKGKSNDNGSKLSLLRNAQEQIDAIKAQHGDIKDLHRFLPEHLQYLLEGGNRE